MRSRWLSVLGFLSLCAYVYPLKFLTYNPVWGRSHVTFIGKLAEVLADAGHDVTMIMSEMEPGSFHGTDHPTVKKIMVPQSEAARAYYGNEPHKFISNAWKSTSFFELLKNVPRLADVFVQQCNATIHHPGLIDQLRKEQFDVAFAEPNEACGMGIFYHIGIDKRALTMSTAVFDGSFYWTGMPAFPSYVPGAMVPFTDRMTFLQRVVNTLSLGIVKYFFPAMCSKYMPLFNQQLSSPFPDIEDIMANSSLFFLNSEPLVEYPRPIVHKVHDIAGVTVSAGHRPLNETWSHIMSLRKKTVLLSFGSVAKSCLMPEAYKKTIKETFRKFPGVTFIWKYEKPEDKISEGIDNIVEATWLPQNDMLHDPRLFLFITHCGQGSTTEATTAGVPAIVTPVLGDQIRNAQVFNHTGSGIVLYKASLEDPELLEETIRTILNDPTYAQKAKELGQMIQDKPFSSRDLFVKNMEFLGKYGPVRMLDHYGRHLNFIQYYLIDVLFFLFVVGVLILLIVYLILRTVFRIATYPCRRSKEKRD